MDADTASTEQAGMALLPLQALQCQRCKRALAVELPDEPGHWHAVGGAYYKASKGGVSLACPRCKWGVKFRGAPALDKSARPC